jgi:hypothetical protein
MMIAEVDLDGEGAIELEEFFELMAKKMKQQDVEEEIIESFKVLDKDGQGYLTKEQLKYFMMTYGEKLKEVDADMMCREADADGDDQIDYGGKHSTGIGMSTALHSQPSQPYLHKFTNSHPGLPPPPPPPPPPLRVAHPRVCQDDDEAFDGHPYLEAPLCRGEGFSP